MFAKEMVEIARRKRYFVNRVLYGLALWITVYVVWDGYRGRFGWQGSASIGLMAEFAERLFHAVSGLQYGAVFLFVPLFLCGVIASEREERTLDLLFTTRLTDREIVLGKLGSRVAVAGFLVLLTMPVLSLIMLFGGVDPLALWRMLACTLLAVLYAGAHAIYFSTITKSAMGALVRTYWWMAVWLIGVPMALLIAVPFRSLAVEQLVMSVFVLLDPLFAFALTIDGASYNNVASYLGAWFFPLAFVLPSGWSFFLLWRAVRRLRIAPTPLALMLRKIPLTSTLRHNRQARARIRAERRRLRAGRLLYLFKVRNPLWLRARQTRVYDREGYIWRIQGLAWFAAFFFVVLIPVFVHGPMGQRPLSERGAAIAFLAPVWILVAGLTAILSGTSLVGDRRRGFLDLVLMTPLTPRQIIDGTLLSVWEHVRRSYWLAFVLGLFFCLTGSCTVLGFACSMVTATLFGALIAVHGTACSLTGKTLPGALVPTVLFPLLVIIGPIFLLVIFREGSGPVLWLLSALFLSVTWCWVRRSCSAAAVGCYFLAVHLVLASLAMCWTWTSRVSPGGYPISVMNPAYMTIQPLDGDSYNPFPWFPGLKWYQPLGCYWLCLLLNFLWARRWLIRHFERLVERTDRKNGTVFGSAAIPRRFVAPKRRPHRAFSSELYGRNH
jgi:ABC-type transport system involved in multi-copper enzyme maturation permease subunit